MLNRYRIYVEAEAPDEFLAEDDAEALEVAEKELRHVTRGDKDARMCALFHERGDLVAMLYRDAEGGVLPTYPRYS